MASRTVCWSWGSDETEDTSRICLSRSSPWEVARTVPLGICPLCIAHPGTCSPRSTSPSPSPCLCPGGRGGGHSISPLCVWEARCSRIYRSLDHSSWAEVFARGNGPCPALCPRSSDPSRDIDHDVLHRGLHDDPHGDESLVSLPFRGGNRRRELACGRGW